jgi:hypothetical protein
MSLVEPKNLQLNSNTNRHRMQIEHQMQYPSPVQILVMKEVNVQPIMQLTTIVNYNSGLENT